MTLTIKCQYCNSVNKPTAMKCRICGRQIRERKAGDIATTKPVVLERVMSGEIFSAIMGKVPQRTEKEPVKSEEVRSREKTKPESEESDGETVEIETIEQKLLVDEEFPPAKDDRSSGDEAANDGGSQVELVETEGQLDSREKRRKKRVRRQLVVAGSPPCVTININAPGVVQPAAPSHSAAVEMQNAAQASAPAALGEEHGRKKTYDATRVRTHIEGFDAALAGGIPEGHVVIVSGSPGTMKSSITFYVLLSNAIFEKRKGLYITLEENSGSLLKQASSVGMPLDKVGEKVSILDFANVGKRLENSRQDWLKTLTSEVSKAMETGEYKILVLDSLGALEVLAKFKDRRREIFKLFQWLRDLGLTSFVIAERPDVIIGGNVIQGRWDEEFLADGIIQLRLHHATDTEIQRRIRCVKMRGTPHEIGYLALLVDEGSFRVTKAISP